MQTRKSFCRFCHANCAILVDVDQGRPLRVRGDSDDPVYGGYTCMKGREMPTQHSHPERLLRTQKRSADGSFASVPTAAAMDEIADRVGQLIERHGPRSIAVYAGTYAFMNSAAVAVAAGFQKAIGSPCFFTPVTIDQPAKVYTSFRVGQWMGGPHAFETADVMMIIGNNPLTSHYAPPGGLPAFSPSRRLRDAKKRGMRLICIDPRRTPTAKLADLHLQVRPGEDAALLGGMLRIILDERRHDIDFCRQYVDGLDTLRAALEPITPEYAAHRADVPLADLYAAARMFADGPRGTVSTGTGTEMSARPSLTEHFVIALNTVCGRYAREGEESPTPRVFTPPTPRRAQVARPTRLWGEGFHPSRVRPLTQIGEEMPTSTVADEILTPGDGQIRALICIGGNPLVAWPNQRKVQKALASLDLLVSIDVRMSQTARLAHYVIAPRVCLEREDITNLAEWWYQEPYAYYTEQIVDPPEGSDVVEEWELFWAMARRLGIRVPLAGGGLPVDRRPSKFELLQLITHGSRLPIAKVRDETRHGGRIFEEARVMVGPAEDGADAKLQLLPTGVPEDIEALLADELDADGRRVDPGFEATHLLVNRRSHQFYNSTGHELEALRSKGVTNYAFMHPDDMDALRCEDGDVIAIASRVAEILGVVAASDAVKSGVISMSHAFGSTEEDARSVFQRGATTNRLVDDAKDFDPITGQCRSSAIPVRVRVVERHPEAAAQSA